MEILGLEKFSMVDWEDKICSTIFTGGCDFACPFCHNALLVKKEVDEISESSVLEFLKGRINLIDGVTISGGEPTLQADLPVFIRKIKNMGYLVKLDTNGSRPEMVENLLKEKLVDFVAMDIKNNFEDYSAICGLKKSPAEQVKKTLQILKKYKVPYELRTTLISGFHKKNNMEKLAKDLEGEKILFLQRFVDSGNLIAPEMGLESVPIETAEKYADILRKTIKKVSLRGY